MFDGSCAPALAAELVGSHLCCAGPCAARSRGCPATRGALPRSPAGGGRYRLRRAARTFGGTLEWWVGRELARRLGAEVETGVRSGAPGVGGDLDVVVA